MFNVITHYPLGYYVMGSFITMAGVLAASVNTLMSIKGDSTACTEAKTFFAANCGLALIHAVMAFYIQWAIKKFVQKEEHTNNPGHEDEDLVKGKDIPHAQIAAAAQKIFLYDFLFCGYFFVFWGATGYNMYGIGDLGDCKGEDIFTGWAAAAVMIFYGFGCANYFFCWFCMQSCCGKREDAKNRKKNKGAPPAEAVGAEAA
jgi:hypothetical protein